MRYACRIVTLPARYAMPAMALTLHCLCRRFAYAATIRRLMLMLLLLSPLRHTPRYAVAYFAYFDILRYASRH